MVAARFATAIRADKLMAILREHPFGEQDEQPVTTVNPKLLDTPPDIILSESFASARSETQSLLAVLTYNAYFSDMKATVTSKGQVTIPQAIRDRLGIKPGQVLEFDETALILKATKAVDTCAKRAVLGCARKALAAKTTLEWIEELRGPAERHPAKARR